MEDRDNRPEQGQSRASGAEKASNHRKRWQAIGDGVWLMLVVLGFSLLCMPLTPGSAVLPTQPEQTLQSLLRHLALAWPASELLVQWGRLLKHYCFARAETTEEIKLFDYLRSEPVRMRIAKYLYQAVWGLVAILLLLGVYYLLRPLF